MAITFRDRDIISITDFSREEILHLCAAGRSMQELEKTGKRNSLRDALKYRTLSYMFYEPSTRTRTSFNTGMRELGGRYDGFSGHRGHLGDEERDGARHGDHDVRQPQRRASSCAIPWTAPFSGPRTWRTSP